MQLLLFSYFVRVNRLLAKTKEKSISSKWYTEYLTINMNYEPKIGVIYDMHIYILNLNWKKYSKGC